MDSMNTGEKVAGASGVALLVLMFLFNWFSYDIGGGGFIDVDTGLNAWQAFGFIDFVLFLAAVSGIALAVVATSQSAPDMPVALSAVTAGLGILAVVLVAFRIISPPDFGAGDFGVDASRSIGVFLGLLATIGVAAGGWMAMQEEGTSFSDPTGGGSSGAAPPPPPSPPPPPPAGGPAA